MTEELDPKIFVDERNKIFFDSIIEKGIKIKLTKILNTEHQLNLKTWYCRPQKDYFCLSFYIGNDSIEYFTHELLHVYLLSKGFVDTNKFKALLSDSPYGEMLLPLDLVGHINNVFAHEKMFPLYIESSFDKQNFTSDYANVPDIYRKEIEDNFQNNGLPNDGILYFIASFYTCMDNKNGSFKDMVREHLNFLSTLEINLFEILNINWNNWKNETDVSKNKQQISELIKNITNWYKNKLKND